MAAIDLPYEVLVYLFKYLPKSDRRAASKTCHSWYLAANDYYFFKNKTLVFHRTNLLRESSPLQVIGDSEIPYNNFIFSELELSNKINYFWDKMGENIRSLTIRKCDIHEKTVDYILQKCTNLEILVIQNFRKHFVSGCLLKKTNGVRDNSFKNLKSLNLSQVENITDAILYRFVKSATELQGLCLSQCALVFHAEVVSLTYPQTINAFESPSERLFTFHFILQFITKQANKIKYLDFSNTLINGAALKLLSQVPDLKLESLRLNTCGELTNAGIIALTTYQPTLRELDIGFCTKVTDQSLMHICNNLINLEYLNIQSCTAVTDLGIAELHKLKNLKRINISACELITKDGIKAGLGSVDENNTIEKIDFNLNIISNIEQTGIIMISEKFKNLRYLDLSFCFNAVTDTSIQVIFKNQILLHTLKIKDCDKVSDVGLTGMGKVEAEGDDEDPVMSHYGDANTEDKMHSGSRAEEDIIRDAQRKCDFQRMCDKLTMDSYTGYSLARIKSLRELNISGCKRITDESLMYAFASKDLQVLDLSRCQEITVKGLKHLVRNCPSIEYLNLNYCYYLRDSAVLEIVKGLPRLQYLMLRDCYRLKDETLKAIQQNCKTLKELDIRGCHNIHLNRENLLRLGPFGYSIQYSIIRRRYETKGMVIPLRLPPLLTQSRKR